MNILDKPQNLVPRSVTSGPLPGSKKIYHHPRGRADIAVPFREIALDPSAREWLADKGWDPAYGARPLKRVIQKAVQDPLAELILSGAVKDGDRVTISAGKQGLTFNGKLAAAA